MCVCVQALSVNTEEKTVTFDDGSVQSYDQLLIATGCRYTLLEFRLSLSVQPGFFILFNLCFDYGHSFELPFREQSLRSRSQPFTKVSKVNEDCWSKSFTFMAVVFVKGLSALFAENIVLQLKNSHEKQAQTFIPCVRPHMLDLYSQV